MTNGTARRLTLLLRRYHDALVGLLPRVQQYAADDERDAYKCVLADLMSIAHPMLQCMLKEHPTLEREVWNAPLGADTVTPPLASDGLHLVRAEIATLAEGLVVALDQTLNRIRAECSAGERSRYVPALREMRRLASGKLLWSLR